MNTQTSFELYGDRTGNSYRAAIGFEEAGLTYAVRIVDLMAGDQRREAYLALNPFGKVPTTVETRATGERLVLTQSNAILQHVAHWYPGLLLPEDPDGRARALERYFYFVTDVIAPGNAAFFLRFNGAGEGAEVMRKRSMAALVAAERFVAYDPFMAGDRFTLADIAAVTITRSVVAEVDWDAVPALRRWYDMVMERGSVQRGFKAFDRPA